MTLLDPSTPNEFQKATVAVVGQTVLYGHPVTSSEAPVELLEGEALLVRVTATGQIQIDRVSATDPAIADLAKTPQPGWTMPATGYQP